MVKCFVRESGRFPANLLLIFLIAAFIPVSGDLRLSHESVKKLNKSMAGIYAGHITHFEKLELSNQEISDPEILNADGKWFAIREEGTTLGWLMADRIWGRYHEFEYALIVDTTCRIINVSVLSYPASHGNAVTGRKWLNGFRGFSPDSLPVFGANVDALSGSTISGTNLTESVSTSLGILKKLKEGDLLK
ncbi:MAG: FMN-binding protein [Bacteroidales bacterium]|nr:FMN-binding protein [Bacteroidales bacterium]